MNASKMMDNKTGGESSKQEAASSGRDTSRLSGQQIGDLEIRLQGQARMLEEREREFSERQRKFDAQIVE